MQRYEAFFNYARDALKLTVTIDQGSTDKLFKNLVEGAAAVDLELREFIINSFEGEDDIGAVTVWDEKNDQDMRPGIKYKWVDDIPRKLGL